MSSKLDHSQFSVVQKKKKYYDNKLEKQLNSKFSIQEISYNNLKIITQNYSN